MTLGTKLYNFRKSKDLSLEKLAFELELSKTAIGKWEADKTKPSIENIIKICDYYETNVYSLLENVDNINFNKTKPCKSTRNIQNYDKNKKMIQEIIENSLANQKAISELMHLQNDLILTFLEEIKKQDPYKI